MSSVPVHTSETGIGALFYIIKGTNANIQFDKKFPTTSRKQLLWFLWKFYLYNDKFKTWLTNCFSFKEKTWEGLKTAFQVFAR